MPNGSNDFSLNYENISEVITQVTQGKDKIAEIVDKLSGIVANLETAWEGTDEISYVEKINSYKPHILKLQKAYEDAAIALQNMSNQYQEKQAENTLKVQSELY